MRCSVRNFSDIVSAYILDDDNMYRFVMLMLHSCMAGAYPTCAVKVGVGVQLVLHRYYVHQPLSRQHLANWVQQDNHALLFVAIKEYVAYAVSTTPGLSRVLHDAYNWAGFAASVTRQADAIRTALNCNVGTPHRMFDAALHALGAVKCFKCPTPPSDQGLVCDNMAAAVRPSFVPDVDVYTTPLRMPIYDIIRPLIVAGAPLGRVARAMGISGSVADALEAAGSVGATAAAWREARKIKTSSTEEALMLHEFVQAWTMCYRVRTYRMPRHIAEEQAQSAGTGDRYIYACVCCRQLREFVVDDNPDSGNAWACGHQKILLDDATWDMFCGKRVEKANVPGRRGPHDSGRSYWKSQQTIMCGYSPLLKVSMLGTILSFFGRVYMLCPLCTCVMCVNAQRYRGDTVRCLNCTYRAHAQHTPACFHCHRADKLSVVAIGQQVLSVCDKCNRKWMHMDNVTSVIDTEVAHQAINERWSTNRILVHCACI